MATISSYYIWTGKSFIANGDSYTIFWRDFNPRPSDIPDPSSYTKDSIKASWETSFNLSWFQNWNEVCFCVYVVEGSWFDPSDIITVDMNFQEYKWWWWNAWWNDSFTFRANYTDWYYRWWHYVWVDYDEIRTDATQYRFLYTFSWAGALTQLTAPFTVSNLSFDTSRHTPWYMRVEWSNLCFIDWAYSSNSWYKHIINYDGAYSGWTGTPWNIWLPSSSTDNHIYYVDENGYVRRTNPSQTRFTSSDYAGSNKAWYIRVSNGYYADDWYAHLCYVNSAWYKRRICNWWI